MVLKKMYRRLVKAFLDVLVLSGLRNRAMSGYDVIAFIHSKFNLLVSSGTVYFLLYSLERDGLTKGEWTQRKRVYTHRKGRSNNKGNSKRKRQDSISHNNLA